MKVVVETVERHAVELTSKQMIEVTLQVIRDMYKISPDCREDGNQIIREDYVRGGSHGWDEVTVVNAATPYMVSMLQFSKALNSLKEKL